LLRSLSYDRSVASSKAALSSASSFNFQYPVFKFNVCHPEVSDTYRVSQEECVRLREGVPYVKVYRYNPKHLCPKLNGYGDNGQRSLKL